LNLDAATGRLSGTPTTAAVYPFILKVTDADGFFGTLPVVITVE
jgi:hypothetical protein